MLCYVCSYRPQPEMTQLTVLTEALSFKRREVITPLIHCLHTWTDFQKCTQRRTESHLNVVTSPLKHDEPREINVSSACGASTHSTFRRHPSNLISYFRKSDVQNNVLNKLECPISIPSSIIKSSACSAIIIFTHYRFETLPQEVNFVLDSSNGELWPKQSPSNLFNLITPNFAERTFVIKEGSIIHVWCFSLK